MDPDLIKRIFQIQDHRTFRETALKVFFYQAEHCSVYRDYLKGIGSDPDSIHEPEEIPFLPVEFFRTHRVISDEPEPELIFESSGTSQSNTARHYVAHAFVYRESFSEAFQANYGPPERLCILALLPSYLERSGSSLVYMMDHLIGQSGHPDSGFYLDNLEDLFAILLKRNEDNYPTLLMGVSFALLDLAEKYPMKLSDHVVVMETGGMKGRRKELVRKEVHDQLSKAFGTRLIHSEYGMTELLSQAYSPGQGIFKAPPWMRVLVRDPNDPFTPLQTGQTGGLNIIDLANLYSCSFIATGDLGKLYEDGTFEVQGRFDHSDIRGCNLMVS